jgi:hypothetical protein
MKARTLWLARTVLIVGVTVALLVPFSASGGTTSRASTRIASLQNQADLYQIDQIEVKFDRSTSTHNQ